MRQTGSKVKKASVSERSLQRVRALLKASDPERLLLGIGIAEGLGPAAKPILVDLRNRVDPIQMPFM
jgi:hypothetical protein